MAVTVSTHTLTQVSQDIANNQSVVRYLVKITTSGQSHNDNNITTTYYIDGVKYTKTHKLPLNSTTTVADKTVTIQHSSDGTRSVSANFSTPTQISAGTMTGSKTLTLQTIPRASQITVNDANIGSSTNIVINKATDVFTTTLWYKTDSDNDWIKIVDKTSNQVYGWTVPTSFYSKIPNNKTLVCYFKADTYNDDTYIGTSSNVSATFTATGNPIINSSSAEDVNSTTTAQTGDSSKMILYVSDVRITINASGQNSASISSIKVNNSSVSNGEITFYGATTNVFNIEVIDSRGYSTYQTLTMTSVNYVNLTLNATIKRNQPTDGKVNISYNGNYYNGSFGNNNNSLTVQYRYVEKGQDINQAQWQSLSPTISGNSYSQSNYQISGFDYQKQYDFQIRAYDLIKTVQINGLSVSKGQPVYWWDDDGFHINGNFDTSDMATNNTTDTWVPVWNNGKLEHRVIDKDINQALLYKNISNYNANEIYDTNIASIRDGANLPSTSQYGVLLNMPYRQQKNNSIPDFSAQIFLPNGDDGTTANNMYFRTSVSNSWNSWQEVAKKSEIPIVSTGSGIVTRTGGANLESSTWRKFGNVVQLTIVIRSTSSTNAGNNCFTGVINDSTFIPKIPINSSTYSGSTGVNCYIDENGNIYFRVINNTYNANVESTAGFTYVI